MRELTLVEFDVVFGGYIGSDGEDNSGPTSIVNHETERLMQEQRLANDRYNDLLGLAGGLADLCETHPGLKIKVEDTSPGKRSGSIEAFGGKGSYTGGGGGSIKVEMECPPQNAN